MPTTPADAPAKVPVAQNRRARHDYEILETFEAGIVLTGSEVKSLREGRANITDGFGIVKDGELWLLNAHIPPYERGGYSNHAPTRTRKLLLHKKEILRLIGALERKGLALVPLELYFSPGGKAKVRLGLGRGKQQHDKRADLKAQEAKREIARALRSRR